MEVKLEELLKLKAIPSDAEKVSNLNTITYSELKLSGTKEMPTDIAVVDNALWVAYSAKKNIYFSSNKLGEVGRFAIDQKQFTVAILNKNKLRTKKAINFKKEGDFRMENLDKELEKEIEGMNFDLSGVEEFAAPESGKVPDVNNLSAFVDDNATAKAGATAPSSDAWGAITSRVSDMKLASNTEVSVFNQNLGKLFGYITLNDDIIKFGVSKKYIVDPATNKRKLKAAPEAVVEAFNRGEDIDDSYFMTENILTKKHTAPGKVLGTVLGIPEGGLFTLSEIRSLERIVPDTSKKDLVYRVYDLDEAVQFISNLFGGSIHEARETFGEAASTVRIQRKQVTKMNKETEVKETITKFVLKPDGRTNLCVRTSYLPIKTYKTVSLNGQITEEEAALLALSSFVHLFKVSRKDSTTKYAKLDSKQKGLISRGEDNVFSSPFFDPDMSKRVKLDIKPYWEKDKNATLSQIEIPVKENVSKDASKQTYRYVTYDCLGALDTPDAVANNSLALAEKNIKFGTFFNAVGGKATLNPTSLRSVKPARKKKKDGNKSGFDQDINRKLLTLALQNDDNSVKFEGNFGTVADRLDQKVMEARLSF